ncbi:hypothetical protein EDB89DRAFT_1858108 [Lactarius sanguifluus]|nr:hypothetical protein EDB89DRAFT_1858108 [Lactarius sanguifluus]
MVLFSTADSPGSVLMSGMVGHRGKHRCRLYCQMPGQHCMGDSHYYPVMNLVDDPEYDVAWCCHPDVTVADLHEFRSDLPWKYKKNLEYLLAACNMTEYGCRRLEVGLCKQTLFSGLPSQPLLVPSIFTMDIMHLSVLNDPDLFIKLFTGKLNCYAPDDRSSWDWAVFYRNQALWTGHGETVTRAVPYMPSSFRWAPSSL